MIVWTFLVQMFGLGRLLAVGFAVVSTISLLGGAYIKGRLDCVSKAEHQSALAKIELQQTLINELRDAALFAEQLQKDFATAEKANDDVSNELLGPVAPGSGCADSGWLRKLDKLR